MKLKVLVVGDLHGRHQLATKAYDLLLKEKYDKVIFIGDYLDSFDRLRQDMLRTINIVLSMKKTYPEKVILLIGNHDEPYFHLDPDLSYVCKGFDAVLHRAICHKLNEHWDQFSYAYGIGSYLFTHAGVSYPWFSKNKVILDMWAEKMDIDITDINMLHVILNNLRYTSDKNILFEVGSERGGFVSDFGGPLWCDKSEIIKGGPLPGLHQVVGHTSDHFISRIHTFEKNKTYPNTSVTFIDCLSHRQQFLKLEINDNE